MVVFFTSFFFCFVMNKLRSKAIFFFFFFFFFFPYFIFNPQSLSAFLPSLSYFITRCREEKKFSLLCSMFLSLFDLISLSLFHYNHNFGLSSFSHYSSHYFTHYFISKSLFHYTHHHFTAIN